MILSSVLMQITVFSIACDLHNTINFLSSPCIYTPHH
jgi:hypothetical protein